MLVLEKKVKNKYSILVGSQEVREEQQRKPKSDSKGNQDQSRNQSKQNNKVNAKGNNKAKPNKIENKAMVDRINKTKSSSEKLIV